MNTKLETHLRSNLTEERRQEVLSMIRQAAPEDSEIADFISDAQIITKIVNLAASYVNSATAKLSRNDPRWEVLIGTTEITISLQELLKNPSVVNYTQAVMLITIALMKED